MINDKSPADGRMSARGLSIAGLGLGTFALLADVPPARADVAFGQYLASECVTCHRDDGQDKGIPSIVGWPTDKFVAVMRSYRSKEREHPLMQTIAGRLSDLELAALAAYYASLKSN